MCRSGTTQQAPMHCSPSRTQSDHGVAEAAAQLNQQPNSSGCSTKLNLNHTLSVFLFDWDDTLFPTSALTSLGPKSLDEAFKAIDAAVAELLSLAIATPRSHVVILTNANISWVHHAAETF